MSFKSLLLSGTLTLGMSGALADTVSYQPTPYPLLRTNGSSMPQDINIVHNWQGWFGNVYNKTLVRNEFLQIGGWGDAYFSPMRFDLDGLPAGVDAAYLYLYAISSGAPNPSQMSMYRISASWNPATVGASNFPATSGGYFWPVSTVINAWRGYTIKTWYDAWKAGTYPNYGMILAPYNNDGTSRFDRFVSVWSTDTSRRPTLVFILTPSLKLKMPFAGGSWNVTTEIGGYDCVGGSDYWPDPFHTGSNYFSIDFTGATGTPILAAGAGVVYEAGGAALGDNGYYIIIDHDGDRNLATGFQTRYLHLQSLPARKNGTLLKNGDVIATGDQIGKMGNSGAYTTGTHLHMGIRYKNNGAKTVNELTKVVMDGKLLKSYQTECSMRSNGTPISSFKTYTSTNVATGR
jgi:Peptidase family M23